MERVNRILKDIRYRDYLKKLENFEKERKFCKHDIEHFLNVSRIMYIYCLEEKIDVDKELIYAAGILHDIGRSKQYEDNIPHHIASNEIALEILKDSGFNSSEIDFITSLILSHRNKNTKKIEKLFYKADKASRSCFSCKAYDECNWQYEKKNNKLIY